MPAGLRGITTSDIDTPGHRWATLRDMEFWAESVMLPDVSLMTHNQAARYAVGPYENRPYNVAFQPIQATFINDGLGDNWTFFSEWINMIFNHDMSMGINTPTGLVTTGLGNLAYTPYELAYKDEYAVDVQIEVFNAVGDVTQRVSMRDAFPMMLNMSPFNWQDNNSYSRFNVTFAYTDYFRSNIVY